MDAVSKIIPATEMASIALAESNLSLAKKLEHDVFVSHGYARYDASGELSEYASYDAKSVFVVASNQEMNPIGVMRLIIGTPFKTLDDLEVDPDWSVRLANEASIEIGTLAVSESAGNKTDIMRGLISFAYDWSGRDSIRWWIATLDSRLARILPVALPLNYVRIGREIVYMGSPCMPVAFDIQQYGPACWQANLYRFRPLFA